MKKIKIIVLLLFFFTGFGSFFHIQDIKTKILYPDKPIHIFYESLATQPALSGMIEMVKLPKDELKIFAWHRFPNRSQLIDLTEINALEVPISYDEGYVILNALKFIPIIEKHLELHPKSPIIIYTNMNNYDYFFSGFLKKIDKHRIKRVHLYEDGLGELFSYSTYFQNLAFNQKDIADLKNHYYNNTDIQLPKHAKYMMHTLFPVTYHFYGLNQAQKMPIYNSFFTEMKGADFEEINFKNLSQTLTSEQKKLLFKLIDFDYEYYKKQFHNNKTFMYFTGFHSAHNHAYNHSELAYLKLLMNKYPEYKFFIKPHPSYSALNRTKNIQELFPSVSLITPQIPFEIFILADLVPTFVSGYASSLFYTLTNDVIESFFPNQHYTKGFDLLNKYDTKKSLNLKQYIPQQPLFYDFIVNKNNQKDYVILQNKDTAFFYLENKIYKFQKYNKLLIVCSDEKCDSYIQNNKDYNYTSIEVLKINHSKWSDFLINIENNLYCRTNDDCGQVTKNQNELTICWHKWGCETFIKTKTNTYKLINS